MLRRPVNFVFFFDFAVALLAGYGATHFLGEKHAVGQKDDLDGLLRWLPRLGLGFGMIALLLYLGLAYVQGTPNQERLAAIANSLALVTLFLLAVLGLLLVRMRSLAAESWQQGAAVALIVLDLFTFGSLKPFNTGPFDDNLMVRRHYEYDLQDGQWIRYVKAASRYPQQNFYRIQPPPEWYTPGQVTLSNAANIWDLRSTRGYSTLWLQEYGDFLKLLENYDPRLLGLANVKYVVTTKPLENTYEGQLVLLREGLYENKAALPVAFVVHEAQVMRDGQQTLQTLKDPTFEPQKVVLLREEPPPVRIGGLLPAPSSDARVVQYTPNRLEVEAALAREGFLVLSEVYYPGWRAEVDGIDAPILKADYIFRAVHLGPGVHRVIFVFDPPTFKIGLAITIATLLLVNLALLGRVIVRMRQGRFSWRRISLVTVTLGTMTVLVILAA